MFRSLLILLLALIQIMLFTRSASAQVVINEFSSWESSGDWIELYALEDVDISGWIIRDTASSIIKTLPGGTVEQ